MAVVLIPVKDPCRAKQRLREVLSQEERTQLAWAMLADLAVAVRQAKRPHAVFLATSSSRVQDFAREQGWDFLREENQLSESSSVDWASSELKKRGFKRVLRLPGDIPLIQPSDIDAVIEAGLSAGSSVIVPSRDGTGTNALLRTPPDVFPSRFGPGSFRLHQQEAECRHVPLAIIRNERIALDIDDPDDLIVFLDRCSAGQTIDLLTSIGARSRLANATA